MLSAKRECLGVKCLATLALQSRLFLVEWLDPQLTALKSSKERGVNRHKSALRRIIEVNPIGRHRRIVAVALQIALRMLERASRSDPIRDAQKQRSRIRRQLCLEVLAELAEIKVAVDDERCHTGCALRSWHVYAVDDRVFYVREGHNRGSHFRGRHVLALPPECVADTIDEKEEATRISTH